MTRIAALAVMLLSACSEDADDTHTHDHGAELDTAAIAAGCDHFEYGPEESLTASDGTTNHSHIHPHVRVALTLPTVDGAHVAFLHLHPEGAPEGYLMLSADVPITATDETGATAAPLATVRDETGCESAALVLHYSLPAEGLYLKLGPTEVDALTLVSHVIGATAADADAHVHDHEHEHAETADAALLPDAATHVH